ncbi:MAG: lactate utilization protein C, partial [Actinomycetota bacterium]
AFPPTPASGDGRADPDRFLAALASTNALGRTVGRGAIAEAVADVAGELSADRRVVVASDADPWRDEIDEGLNSAGATVVRPDPPAWRDQAARADLGITSAALGIASTGTLLLVPDADAPRVASLLPAMHLAILPIERLVPGLEDALAGVEEAIKISSGPVLITGPSRTSDIEMTTVYGVHGPRSLRVLLVV